MLLLRRTVRAPPVVHCNPTHRRPFLTSRNHLSKWGVFSDVHFQSNDLPRIVQTSNWILSAFRSAPVTQIICVGDILHTRETVNVQALSATVRFFDQLRCIAPVHVVLGNHDMNYKQFGNISGLDYLEAVDRVNVYREMTRVQIDGRRCLMVPWVENHQRVAAELEKVAEGERRETIVFAHLALAKAKMNRRRKAPTEGSSVLSTAHLRDFKGALLGHFHYHQQIGDGETRVWYVGSPMQHHFGDLEDHRGVVLLDPQARDFNSFEYLRNPEWDVFRELSLKQLAEVGDVQGEEWTAELPFDVRGKRISLSCYTGELSEFDKWQKLLKSAGAESIRRKLEAPPEMVPSSASGPQQVPTSKHNYPDANFFIDAIPEFLSAIPPEVLPPAELPRYSSVGVDLMRTSEQTENSHGSSLSSSLPEFDATIRTLSISNFLSVQGTIVIPFSNLEPGVWFIAGPNGSGKSMVLESITWCLFGETLRADIPVKHIINDKVGKNCVVRMDFENGYSIERLRSCSSRGVKTAGLKLYRDGVEVENFERGTVKSTQEALERDIIGCNFNTFTKSVIFGDQGRGAGNFLSLDRDDRREVLEELLGVRLFQEFLGAARRRRKDVELEQTELRNHLGRVQYEVQRVTTEKERLQSSLAPKRQQKKALEAKLGSMSDESETERKIREQMQKENYQIVQVKKLIDQVRELEVREHGLGREIHETSRLKEAGRRWQRATDRVKTATENIEEFESYTPEPESAEPEEQESVQAQGAWEAVVSNVRARFQSIFTRVSWAIIMALYRALLKQGAVPADMPVVRSPAEIEKEKQEIERERQEIEREARERERGHLNESLAFARQELVNIQNEYEMPEAELSDIAAKAGDLTSLRGLQVTLKTVMAEKKKLLGTRRLSDLERIVSRAPVNETQIIFHRVQKALSERNGIVVAIAQKEAEIKYAVDHASKLSSQIEQLETEAGTLSQKVEKLDPNLRALQFWESAFDKRSSSSAAAMPNMRHFLISHSISELNELIAANLAMITSETSTDDLSISFNTDLSVHPPTFAKRSSGQRKRNNLAVLFALFQLARVRSRFRSNFIMLDEVFDALDADGKTQAAGLVATTTTDRIGVRHALVITHDEGLDEAATVGEGGRRVLKVSKGDNGRTVIEDPLGFVINSKSWDNSPVTPELVREGHGLMLEG